MHLRWLGVFCLVCGGGFLGEHFVSVLDWCLWDLQGGLRAGDSFAFYAMYLLPVIMFSLLGSSLFLA